MTTTCLLGTHGLADHMVASLPKDASPQLKNAYDAIALVAHAALLSVGFRLIGLDEDSSTRIENSEPGKTQPLPSEWNKSTSSLAFRYAHTQSSMNYLLRVNRMGSKAVVMGMGVGDDKTASFDVRVEDYISQSSLPATPSAPDTPANEARRKIIAIFVSDGRVADIGSLMRINIIQKLVPSLQKDESRERSTGTATTPAPARQPHNPLRDEPQPARPYPLSDPLAHARRPRPHADFPPPDFEDPYDLNRPVRPMGGGIGPSYGQRDLYPQGLGPNDPFRNIGPGLGGPSGGGGGMHPTFDDPLFRGPGGGGDEGYGYDPQAPPGSRYDPVGPGGRPPRGSGGGGFPGGGGFGGGAHNPFGGFGGNNFI